MKIRKILAIVLFMTIAFLGCSKKESKVDIPEITEPTKLSDILKNPLDFRNKNVLLKGFVVSVCPSGCDMVYQEGKDTTEIYPKGFKFPRLKSGTPVKVYAEITVGKERVIISALKLEVVK